MSSIKSLFDPSLNFERRVEKVITFSNREADILLNEARDYVLTDNLTSEYQKLLNQFADAQSNDSSSIDCCTWLSGFYGSGKSSFAKYFGLSFDKTAQIDDVPFYEHFTKRFPDLALQQQVKTLAKKYNVVVFLLDLASQGTAGANHTPISTLLFDQVCTWAGYPADRKLGELALFLELQGRFEEFKAVVQEISGMEYEALKDFSVILVPVASQAAHRLYPGIWKDADAFQNTQAVSTKNEQERLMDMLALIEKKAGTRRVMFIIDEVGHFLRNNDSLINNFDGLAKNIRELGKGEAWLIATAQQTIPKTGPLFGLQDRFPIKIDLKASDIREITHKRLLKKSADGAKQLQAAFATHGAKLNLATRLSGCEGYPALDEATFVDFYPLLPQQFELLIRTISALAKMHGGVGLRSAIRCVEDILLDVQIHGGSVLAAPTGTLVTAAHLYDVLEKDIVSAAREICLQVDVIGNMYGKGSLEQQIAKVIALLQQIDGFPSTKANIAALLHPGIESDSLTEAIEGSIKKLLANTQIPLGFSKEGHLSFLSELVAQVEKERNNIPVTSTHRETAQNGILGELFSVPPKTSLLGTKTVDAGIWLFDGHREANLSGNDREIRLVLRLVAESQLDDAKTQLSTESLGSSNQEKIYLAAARPGSLDVILNELYRAEEICRMNRNHTDQEVQRYIEGQKQLITEKRLIVQQLLRETLRAGWFVFRGQLQAVEALGDSLEKAASAKLSQVATVVFHDYERAAQNVKAQVAEDFLRAKDISQINSERDPLKVVKVQGSSTEINLQHPALVRVLEFLQRHPNPDGKRLLEEFARPPYGWNKDTTRYLVAALFYAQKVKLRSNGADLTVVGEQSLEAFKNNTSFAKITVAQNLAEIPPEVRQKAAQRLSQLTGESVLPTPQRIAEQANTHLPRFQSEVQPLPRQLGSLGIDTERLDRLQRSLIEAQGGDGAEATRLFGSEASEIFDDLLWARKIKSALEKGAAELLGNVAKIQKQVQALDAQGALPELQAAWSSVSATLLQNIQEGTFAEDLPALGTQIDELNAQIAGYVQTYVLQQQQLVLEQIEGLQLSADFKSLPPEIQAEMTPKIQGCLKPLEPTLEGIQKAGRLTNESLAELQNIRGQIQKALKPAPVPAPIQPSPVSATPAPVPPSAEHPSVATVPVATATIRVPAVLRTAADLDALLLQLTALRDQLAAGNAVNLSTAP
jgi:hypothetical protein